MTDQIESVVCDSESFDAFLRQVKKLSEADSGGEIELLMVKGKRKV